LLSRFFILISTDRKLLSPLLKVGLKVEVESGDFRAQTLPDRALNVKLPPFCGSVEGESGGEWHYAQTS
jgi:hypothetical protein